MRAVTILLVLLPACVAIPPEVASSFDDYADWYLLAPLTYQIGDPADGNTITVPEGFVTDYASIPRAACLFMPKDGRHSRAAIVHDFLYWSGESVCTKDQADMIMYLAMEEQGVDYDRRETIYAQLQNFGHSAWKQNAEARSGPQPQRRVIPPALIDKLRRRDWEGTEGETWEQYQPVVQKEYATTGEPEPNGEVRVDWTQVTADFEQLQKDGSPPWWAFWNYLKFWQWY